MRVNNISSISHNGRDITIQSELNKVFTDHYKEIFGKTMHDRIQIDWQNLYPSDTWDCQCLEVPFTEDEIKSDVFSTRADSSPGSDGFLALFYQEFWQVVEDVLMDITTEFSYGCFDIQRIYYAWVVLLSKKDGADTVTDYRPISLLNAL